jgi:CubicO group peptidase (beta-lactamase class C family)
MTPTLPELPDVTRNGDVEAAVAALGSRPLGLDGVHVAVEGRPSVERRWSPDVRRDVFSASKTVTSLAVGIAQSEGLLSVEDLVVDHLPRPDLGYAAGMERVTIRHLLTMSSGITYRWDDPDADQSVADAGNKAWRSTQEPVFTTFSGMSDGPAPWSYYLVRNRDDQAWRILDWGQG